MVKPSTASGSEGVTVVTGEAELAEARRRLEEAGHEVVVEEYVAGPSLSLEVLAWGGRAVPLQVTGLEFDAAYDCKRVVAPVESVEAGTLAAFDAAAVRLGEGLHLNGLMDVEVLVRDGETIVIGGLIHDTQSETIYKVPLLGDIPLLGYLFRKKSMSRSRMELIIFVTPRIIEG